MRFTKMHGCGNDYVYVDAWDEPTVLAGGPCVDLPALALAVSDRHMGIGGDGLIVLAPPTAEGLAQGAQARMVMLNADGSTSEMCGNGIRCVAKLASDHGRVGGDAIRIETGAGVLAVDLRRGEAGMVVGASVSMGAPRLDPATVPVVHPGPGPRLPVDLEVARLHLRLLAVGMGNPHAVCWVPDPETFPVTTIGPLIEHHPRFPRRTNVEFVALAGEADGIPVIRQRTWERGSGETLACGTGACATAVAAILEGRIPGRQAIIRLSGGDLHISWPDDQSPVRMTGPAVTVFRGVWSG